MDKLYTPPEVGSKWFAALNSNSMRVFLRCHNCPEPPFVQIGALSALYTVTDNKGFQLHKMVTHGDCTIVFKGFPQCSLIMVSVTREPSTAAVLRRVDKLMDLSFECILSLVGVLDFSQRDNIEKLRQHIAVLNPVVDYHLSLTSLPSCAEFESPCVAFSKKAERDALRRALTGLTDAVGAVCSAVLRRDADLIYLCAGSELWIPFCNQGRMGGALLSVMFAGSLFPRVPGERNMLWPSEDEQLVSIRLVYVPLAQNLLLLMMLNDRQRELGDIEAAVHSAHLGELIAPYLEGSSMIGMTASTQHALPVFVNALIAVRSHPPRSKVHFTMCKAGQESLLRPLLAYAHAAAGAPQGKDGRAFAMSDSAMSTGVIPTLHPASTSTGVEYSSFRAKGMNFGSHIAASSHSIFCAFEEGPSCTDANVPNYPNAAQRAIQECIKVVIHANADVFFD